MLSLDKLRGGKFANWSQNERSTNFELYTPSSIEEVTAIIAHSATANKNLRVIGAGHSFSPVAKPEHSAMTLHNMRGMITIDEDKQQATFWAGTYLHEVGPLLAKYGLALENMGDIAEQSIAGAISTGTHGTGLKLRSVSNQIVKWCFIDGQGHYQEVGRDQDDLSQALHISLGLLGVIVQVTFQAVPLYALRYTSSHVTLADTLRDAQGILQQYRHAEWFYFPGQEKMQLKTMEQIQLPMSTSTAWQKWTDDFMENTVFHMLSSSCKWYPKATKWVSKVSANAVPVGTKEAYSYQIFPSPRKVRFVEMEYAIPLHQFEAALEEIHYVLKSNPFKVHFPIECRVSAGETGFLSPTQGQNSAFFAFHMYKGMPYEEYFKWAHNMMESYGARPHLGKMNKLTHETMYEKYEDFSKFLNIREKMDPNHVFMTPYFNHLLQPKTYSTK